MADPLSKVVNYVINLPEGQRISFPGKLVSDEAMPGVLATLKNAGLIRSELDPEGHPTLTFTRTEVVKTAADIRAEQAAALKEISRR